jgi:hypothetical protein
VTEELGELGEEVTEELGELGEVTVTEELGLKVGLESLLLANMTCFPLLLNADLTSPYFESFPYLHST